MVLAIASSSPVAPTIVAGDGGTKITISGDANAFQRELGYRVYVGPNGNTTDPLCYAAPGKGNIITPTDDQTLECYLPELTSGEIYNVFVEEVGTAETGLVADEITVIEPTQSTAFFGMKRLFPPNRVLGKRSFDLFAAPAAAKNYVIHSDDLSDAVWTLTTASLVTGEEDPFGGTLGYILHEDGTAGSAHSLAQLWTVPTPTLTAGNVYTASMYVKAINRTECALVVSDGSDPTALIFDLAAGTVGAFVTTGSFVPGISGTIEVVDLVTGWYRLGMIFRPVNTAAYGMGVQPSEGGVLTFNGLNQDSLRVAFPALDPYPLPRAYRETGASPIL